MPLLPSDPYATLTYDLQLTGQRFAIQEGQYPREETKNAPAALIRDSQDDESCVMPRWVSADVSESCVKGDQGALFLLAGSGQIPVWMSA